MRLVCRVHEAALLGQRHSSDDFVYCLVIGGCPSTPGRFAEPRTGAIVVTMVRACVVKHRRLWGLVFRLRVAELLIPLLLAMSERSALLETELVRGKRLLMFHSTIIFI